MNGSKAPPGLESTPTSAHPSLTSSPGIAEAELPIEDGETDVEVETPVPADVGVSDTEGLATPQPPAEEKEEGADEEVGSTETHTTTNVTLADSGHADSISPAPSPLPASPPERDADGYQPSVQAQALIDDVRQRREPALPVYQIQSPYPDFEDVLQCFNDGDFTYNLDVKLEVEEGKLENLMASVEDILAMGRAEAAAATPAYEGAFDPFLDPQLDEFGGLSMTRNASGGIEEDSKKKGSRFGFANRSGPSDTNIPLLASVMGQTSKLGPDLRAFSQLDMSAAARAQENRLNHPNYFAGLPGTAAGRPEAEMTPSSKSAMPYPQQSSSPAQTHRDQGSSGSSMPPPPPGLGGPANPTAYQGYQQMSGNRSMQQAMEQQMMANMHGYQHQFQADGRRTASPGIPQALRNGGAGASRFATGREGYATNGS